MVPLTRCGRWRLAAWLLAALVLPACSGVAASMAPPEGVLTLTITPSPATSPLLQITSGHLEIENLTVLGDVAPDARSMVPEFGLDLAAGKTLSFTMLPQGLYSGVHFSVSEVLIVGSWRGVPLHVQLASDLTVDLHAMTGVEISPGHDAALPITVAIDNWFAGNLLDSATQSPMGIYIDRINNAALVPQLSARIVASFALHNQPIP